MDALNTQSEIVELENLRRQTSFWRLGAGILSIAWVAGCMIIVNDSVRGLFNTGPRQEKFVSILSSNIQKDIAPGVQTLAAQTIAQARPEVEASFTKLNGRVPELASASVKELQSLQTSLPAKGQKLLGSTFGEMITSKDQKIRQMFPDATEENVKALTQNLTAMGQERAVSVNNKLIGKHQTALNDIVSNMEKIRLDEAKTPASAMGDNWDMALAFMDVVHDDMKDIQTVANQRQKSGTKAVASAELPNNKVSTK